MPDPAQSSHNRTVARHSPVPSAPRGSDPAAAGALSEVRERQHDPAWFSVGLPLAGTSPGYLVMRLSLPSVDYGSAAPALHRRGVFAGLARHHFRPPITGFSREGERTRPGMTLSDKTKPYASSTQMCHRSEHHSPHGNTNPITEQAVTGRPEILRRHPALPSARSIPERYVAG